MLELISVSKSGPRQGKEVVRLLDQVSFGLPKGHLMAVVGPPAGGKSTLLAILAGAEDASGGTLLFHGKDVSRQGLEPNAIGHVPATDDTLHEELTVRESVMSALLLRVAGQSKEQRVDRASHLLVTVGLEMVATHRVSTLGQAQRRRLKLALALVSDPALVVCDSFTDGLDVKSAQELAALLKLVVGDHPSRVVIHATGSLGNLPVYDTVVILHEGHVCFHGPSRALTHYFSIETVAELFPRLARRPAQRWGESWARHRDSYYEAFKLGTAGESLKAPGDEDEGQEPKKTDATGTAPSPAAQPALEIATSQTAPQPSFAAQASHLILRRWTLLKRRRKDWIHHLVLLLAPPVITALLMKPNMAHVQALASATTVPPETLWPAAYTCTMAFLVQTLFIMITSVRIGAREIAGERAVFERERTAGLRSGAYLLGKLGFLIPVVVLQALFAWLFLEITLGSLPGNAALRLPLLACTGVAFTSLCLGTSAWGQHPERAHSRCWMLFAVNLMLAGALLGFPRALGSAVQPFITAYYGWSGMMETILETSAFRPVTKLVPTYFATPELAFLALAGHFAIGVLLGITGLRRR